MPAPRLLLAGLVGLLGGCTPEAPDAPWFRDVTAAAGLAVTHVRGLPVRHFFPEIMSGGACWLDYDADGFLDLYFVQGGALDPAAPDPPGNRLFRNRGDGTFDDVTDETGTGDTGYGMGCATGDYDGDGLTDLYVTNVGPNRLFRNRGDGAFDDVTDETGTGHPGWGTSAAFLDYDGDDRPDLFVVNYVDWAPDREVACYAGGERDYCHPDTYHAPAVDVLYHNEGGTFRDVTAAAGLRQAHGNGLGLTVGDFDDDGRPDLYVANDGNPNQLWINRGDGTFEDRALRAGSAVNRQGMAEAGMGVVAADVEGDGDLDLFMTHLRDETNTLYRNRGGLFEDVTVAAGLAVPSLRFTGFGTGMADFDLDGRLDLFVANGRVGRTLAPVSGDDPYAEPDQVFRGLGAGRFVERPSALDPSAPGTGRAAAFADYDNDGDVDVVVVNNGGPLRLFRNEARGAWVGFDVRDRHGHVAVGARVGLATPAGPQWRPVNPAYSYLAGNDPRVHFGLGTAPDTGPVTVVWPGGRRTVFDAVPAGAYHVLRAPE